MKIRIRFLAGVCLALPLFSAAQEQQALSGYEAFAQEPAMSSASVSPDGEHLATLQRFAKDGKQFLLVYDLSDMAKRPVTLGSDRMDIVSAGWANNERLIVRFRQDVDTLQRLGADTRQVSKLATVDREGKRWLEIPRRRADRRSQTAKTIQRWAGASVFDLLPKDDDHILIEYDDDQNFVADIFRVNVETGSAQRVVKNSDRINITYLDDDGDPRLAFRFDEGSEAIIDLARLKGETDWIEIGRTQASVGNMSSIFNAFRIVGPPSSNEFYVLSNHETDTAAIYTFDLETREFGEMQFMHPRYDATGVRTRLDEEKNDVIIGFTFTGKAGDVYLVDQEEKALYDAIDGILPDTDNSIVSRSHDGKTMVIRAEGPRTPRSWYLLKEGRLDLLGRSMPFLTEDMLAEVEWVRYEARDGMEIPALVTVPRGDGPFPLVVLPHGGPVARDYWGFDVWAQLLAYHGYVVIQPQFRISDGFGRRHLESGFSRWGYEMQDDLEDAIGYLAQRNLGDPGRAAIFGWSYGGYAAFVGSFRDPNPFRCAIAGAGVADLPYFRAWLADSGTLAEKAYRPTVDGVNPLEHVDSVDVPILVIHGDDDERVPVDESRKFVAKLKEYDKHHKYIELEGANHFFGTIYYRHYMEMYPAMIDWLDNTCNLKATTAAAVGPASR
ncbi:MAG: S9 family peptidase [Gammaproteobacteria bacterium]|nr:S9 family peptidase [Gammaproteobacteria bacterium]MYL00927.1 S9 family peptidase [Gammaproteobacteria bacterium]